MIRKSVLNKHKLLLNEQNVSIKYLILVFVKDQKCEPKSHEILMFVCPKKTPNNAVMPQSLIVLIVLVGLLYDDVITFLLYHKDMG